MIVSRFSGCYEGIKKASSSQEINGALAEYASEDEFNQISSYIARHFGYLYEKGQWFSIKLQKNISVPFSKVKHMALDAVKACVHD